MRRNSTDWKASSPSRPCAPARANFAALATLTTEIEAQVKIYGSIRYVPAGSVPNMRNDMYLTGAAIRLLDKEQTTLAARG
jgi:hypothetical protein